MNRTTMTPATQPVMDGLIPVFQGRIGGAPCNVCDARTLHTFLEARKDFSSWIKDRIEKYKFVDGDDFATVETLSSPNLVSSKARRQRMIDYHLTLDMGKELSMVENNEKGRQARKYFIECERRATGVAGNGLPPLIKKSCDLASWRLASEHQRRTMELIGSTARPGDEDISWSAAFLLKKRLNEKLAAISMEMLAGRASEDQVTDHILGWTP